MKRRHFDVAQSAPTITPQTVKKGKKGGFTAAAVRAMMADSSEGGRARCDYCFRSYSANYVKPVIAGNFEDKYACGWCRKQRKLQIRK